MYTYVLRPYRLKKNNLLQQTDGKNDKNDGAGSCKVTSLHQGCTKIPLFDSVAIKNYIVPVLHLLIGIGNNLVDSLFEWILKRFEKLSPDELVHQNAVIYAEACYRKFKANFDNWMENEGITLTDLQVPKAALAFMLAERVIIANFIIRSV
jgi:hypothetical protein